MYKFEIEKSMKFYEKYGFGQLFLIIGRYATTGQLKFFAIEYEVEGHYKLRLPEDFKLGKSLIPLRHRIPFNFRGIGV